MKRVFKFSLMGLLAWHGLAGALSESDFLSGLRGMGLFGFQHGTISKKDVGDRSFIDAVEKRDVHLLLQRIQDRLNGPFPAFMEDLHAVDENGRNVFHALAEVSGREEQHFAEVMTALIRISGFHIDVVEQDAEIIKVANMIISPKLSLENDPLIQTIRTAKSHSAVLKEVEKFVKENSAVTVVSYLHGKTTNRLNIYSQTFLELLLTRDPNLRSHYRRYKDSNIHQPYLMRDAQGFLPIAIAERSGNLPAFSHLYKYYKEENINLWFLGLSIVGGSVGVMTGNMLPIDIDSVFLQFALGANGMIAGGFVAPHCQEIFSSLRAVKAFKKRNETQSISLIKP